MISTLYIQLEKFILKKINFHLLIFALVNKTSVLIVFEHTSHIKLLLRLSFKMKSKQNYWLISKLNDRLFAFTISLSLSLSFYFLLSFQVSDYLSSSLFHFKSVTISLFPNNAHEKILNGILL